MGKVTLRSIQKEDLEFVRKLRNRNRKHFLNKKVITPENQAMWFKSLVTPFYVIEQDDKPVGTISVRNLAGRFEIHNVIINARSRRQGILRKAIEFIEQKFPEFKPFYLEVLVHNTNAIEAYEKIGFRIKTYRMMKK